MCPLWPLHILLLYILIVAPLLLMAQHVPTNSVQSMKKLNVAFGPELDEKIKEDESKVIEFQIADLDDFGDRGSLEVEVTSSHPDIAEVYQLDNVFVKDFTPNTNWTGSFNLSGKFLGYTRVVVKLWGRLSVNRSSDDKGELLAESEPAKVSVIRPHRAVDTAFIYTVAILVSIAFINMGCIVDLEIVKATLKKPIGPLIGFCSQYLFMPLCAFGLAKLLLWDNVALQLGLFVTGCSPGGGGSNIWTFLLGGNLNLSVTMTFLSTLAAFAMMPLWTMTLGRLIFVGHIAVPYRNIATLAAGLVIPLMIGVLIRRFLPKVANVMAKMLKYVAVIFVVVIVVFGIYANLYMIKLMNDWRVLLSSFSLVTLGYLFGGVFAILLRQPWPDALTVAIETGVQNTGISIFILRVTLDQPEADINTVIPVAVAIFTPLPLIIMWIIQKCVLVRHGVCVPTEDPDLVKPPADVEQNGKAVHDAVKNGHAHQNGHSHLNGSSAKKLLPNNNCSDIITVNVKVLDVD